MSDNDSVLESPSQHESGSVAEDGLDRCDGWSFRVGATLVAVDVANALIAAGSEQLEEGEGGAGEPIAMAGGEWAFHHFK